jgi:hypothetical protein
MRLFLMLALVLLAEQTVAADSTWLEAGDGRLRADLTLLVDRGVLDVTLDTWPISAADIARAVAEVKAPIDSDATVAAAFARVQARLGDRKDHGYAASEVDIRGGRPALVRDFDATMRQDGEITDKADFKQGRWSGQVSFTAVTAAADEQPVRFDGSHLTYQLWNWLFSANALDRYWGPGYESALEVSQNARPIPALAIDRATSSAFVSPWLCWIGTWRFSTFLGQLEQNRRDVRSPLFFGARLTIRPLRYIEIGFSRTAQFCGSGRKCGLTAFKNMLFGHDNPAAVGGNVSFADEPGNQMAGFDVRISSPWQALPVAFYSQMIGEDQQGLVPFKYLAQFGAESWLSLANGASLRGFIEYAGTACDATRNPPLYDCSYRQHIFDIEGYRYRGRVIGDSIDSDGEIWSTGLRLVKSNGQEWRLHARSARLNLGAGPASRNTLSAVTAKYRSLEVGWRGTVWSGGELDLSIGGESYEPYVGPRRDEPYGAVILRQHF